MRIIKLERHCLYRLFQDDCHQVVWLYFKTTCDVKPDLTSAEIISYEQKEHLRYGYRQQQQQLQSKSNLVAHNTDNYTQTMQEQPTSLSLDSFEIELRQTPQSIIIRSRPCSDYSPQDDQLYNKHLYSTVSHETIKPYIVLVYKDVQKYIDLYFPVLHVRLPMYNYSIKMINNLSSTLAQNGIKLVYGNIKIEYFSPTYVSPYEHI
ncbi:unnamed protein product [Didymodactylos carnosus]|uniref:Uncharacterized protein n=1 Tax=Didymodactylos carnosus TaxID=1234261 RepID=A0A814U6L5_9BILA|nr:unnamed protein product [Didymodactylos carnosus]CAF1170598.1 unnamed protein product [Didymodactylos carnosus]CAF3699746.1 unnamed protein product [Didymodactylos carnosus]CAF3934315.1 unnamed protein product [Didymodactylos carnosus]